MQEPSSDPLRNASSSPATSCPGDGVSSGVLDSNVFQKKLESLDACFFCDFCFGTLPIDFRTAVSCLATRDLTGRVEQAVSLIRKYVKVRNKVSFHEVA